MAFIAYYNQTAKPFRSTYKGAPGHLTLSSSLLTCTRMIKFAALGCAQHDTDAGAIKEGKVRDCEQAGHTEAITVECDSPLKVMYGDGNLTDLDN